MQVVVAVAVVRFFWRDRRGHGTARVVAPLLAALLLTAGLWLVVANIDLLTGKTPIPAPRQRGHPGNRAGAASPWRNGYAVTARTSTPRWACVSSTDRSATGQADATNSPHDQHPRYSRTIRRNRP